MEPATDKPDGKGLPTLVRLCLFYAAIYARLANAPCAVVSTIHNLAYRGIFSKTVMTELGIPWPMFTPKLLEFYDQVSFLKAGMALADAVTTVSPSYAQEILTPERGEALDGFLRWDVKRLVGIVSIGDLAKQEARESGEVMRDITRPSGLHSQ